eukprot:Plantae.Rhodophyta-Hildenbrandia_rubra.ctg151.p1 GENE.Plantae.Rhodophyta-Hildenbrandia_rubra.ctg151~~Plantae.Rhodophyta-Hildenbrandia_rubra.ctg151.p1  ORF type:complete len:680 (+),score=115.18 Plantae.Rhodophyta-Hildenbrandia_rubra.ctg151:58-2097(+)
MDAFATGENHEDKQKKQSETRLQLLEEIQRDPVEKAENIKVEELKTSDAKDSDLLDEDAALERLRRSDKYRKYAETRKTKVMKNNQQHVEGENTPKAGIRSEQTSAKRPRTQPTIPICKFFSEGPHVAPESTKNHLSEKEILANNVERKTEGHQGTSEAKVQRKGPKRLKIDPKIIDDSSDDSDDSSDDEGNQQQSQFDRRGTVYAFSEEDLPISHEVTLGTAHDTTISSIDVDQAGSRIITTSYNQNLKLWDFGGMNSRLLPFRNLEPLGEHSLGGAEFSTTGNILIYGSAHAAKILSRDGEELASCPSGFMYSVDMARTKGHASEISSAAWHPAVHQQFCTTSGDGTLRLWEASETNCSQSKIMKLRNARGGKLGGSRLCYASDGKSIVLGCEDSSLKIFDPSSYSPRPALENDTAIRKHSEITSVAFSPLSCPAPLVLVRSCDDVMRLFDVRSFQRPLMTAENLPCAVSRTRGIFVGETGRYLVTGTSARRKSGENANLVYFDRQSRAEVNRTTVDVERGSVVALAWNPVINQILYGCADGTVKVQYRPETSKRGILQCVEKHQRRKQHGFASVGPGKVFTPALESGQATRKKKPSSGGIPLPHRPSILQTLEQQNASGNAPPEDPREALLRLDAETRGKNIFGTQSVKILADKTAEQEEQESRQAIEKTVRRKLK